MSNQIKYIKKWQKQNPDKVKEYSKRYYLKNKNKRKKYKKQWLKENPNYKRNHWLIINYGLTLEDYNKMFAKQKGCCAICNTHQSEFKKALAVDHNHKTKNVRGLLCPNCNNGLGNFKDNIELLKKAIKYL